MEVEHTDYIEAPVEQVYLLVRDQLPSLAAYLPNIKKIERLSLEDVEGSAFHRIVNRWYADVDVPFLFRPFLPVDLFSWKDVAHWDDEAHSVSYVLESFFANDLFSATGTNRFVAKGTGTELHVTCQVKIHGDRVPGVPAAMAAKVTPIVEKLIEKMLAPNLTSLGTGLKAFLKKKKRLK